MKVLKPEERNRLVENIAGHLKDAQDFIQQRTVNNFGQADPEFGRLLSQALAVLKKQQVFCLWQ